MEKQCPFTKILQLFVNKRTRFRLGTEQRVETALCWILLDRRVIKGWLNVRLNVQRMCTGTEGGAEGQRYRVKSREARTSKGLTIVAIHFEQLTIGEGGGY